MRTPHAGVSPRLLLLAAAVLGAAAVLSPEFLATHLSADHVLSPHMAARARALRAAAALAGLVLLAWGRASAASRERLLKAVVRLPEKPWFAPLALAAAAAFLWTERGMVESDVRAEGILAYGAWKVSAGAVPCRDFFTYVAPGAFYLLAGVFKVFGPSLEAARFFMVFLPKLLSAALFHRLARRLLPPGPALGAAAFAVLFMSDAWQQGQIYNFHWSYLLALAGLESLAGYFETGRRRWLTAAGVLAGLCAAIRQDIGLYLVAAQTAALVLVEPRASARYLVSFGAVALSVGGAMLLAVPWPELRECYIEGPAVYMKMASTHGRFLVPFNFVASAVPGGSWGQILAKALAPELILLVCWAATLAGSAAVWHSARREPGLEAASERTFSLIVLWAVFSMANIYKGQTYVFACTAPAAVLALAVLLRRLPASVAAGLRRTVLASGFAAMAIPFLIMLFFRPLGPWAGAAWIETAAGRYLCPNAGEAADLGAALGHVRKAVPPEGRIFVYEKGKSCGHILFHFLALRHSASRYHELAPGITTEPRAQARIIRDISGGGAARILETVSGQGLSGSAPADELDRFILAHYSVEARYGPYVIWKPK